MRIKKTNFPMPKKMHTNQDAVVAKIRTLHNDAGAQLKKKSSTLRFG
jgi:hypothetical protein